jgi:hypothetical protein
MVSSSLFPHTLTFPSTIIFIDPSCNKLILGILGIRDKYLHFQEVAVV